MALTNNVQNDKFPYLARQITGDVAKAFGYGIDHIYEADAEFIDFLSNFNLENLSGEWLDKLGIVLGEPRPYVTKPELKEAFQFDVPAQILDGRKHGFSTSIPITIDGVRYDITSGGQLDDLNRDVTIEKVEDSSYREYLKATSLLKRKKSIIGIANVVEVFVNSQRYAITFLNNENYVNDIVITLPVTLSDYQEALQSAFDRIFTTAPRVLVESSLYFDEAYTIPTMETTVSEITGSYDFTIDYEIIENKAVFNVTLDASLSQYVTEVQEALDLQYSESPDVVIHVTVGD